MVHYYTGFKPRLINLNKTLLKRKEFPFNNVSEGFACSDGHDGQRDERGHSHYLNEPPLYELLVSRKKAMIDLREDHLSRCVRSRGRRSEVREG